MTSTVPAVPQMSKVLLVVVANFSVLQAVGLLAVGILALLRTVDILVLPGNLGNLVVLRLMVDLVMADILESVGNPAIRDKLVRPHKLQLDMFLADTLLVLPQTDKQAVQLTMTTL